MFSKHLKPAEGQTALREGSAFTLAELILSLLIASVLMALILPTAMRQFEAARATSCVSKLRNLGVAIRLWRIENKDALMPSTNVVSWRPSRHLYEAGAISSPDEMLCPSINTVEKGAWSDVTNGGNAPYQIAFNQRPISYGVNALAFNMTTPKGWGKQFTSTYKMFLGREADVPLFFCARVWQLNSAAWESNEERLRRFVFPHHQSAHVLFLDGHVGTLDKSGVLALHPLGLTGEVY